MSNLKYKPKSQNIRFALANPIYWQKKNQTNQTEIQKNCVTIYLRVGWWDSPWVQSKVSQVKN